MNMAFDTELIWLFSGVLVLLALSSIIGYVLSRKVVSEEGLRVVANLNARTRAWWVMCVIFTVAVRSGGGLGRWCYSRLRLFWPCASSSR